MNKYITGLRFDLAAKTLYVKYRVKNIQTKWHEELYREHIQVFNGGVEIGGTKKTVDDFVRVLNDLVDNFSIEKAGVIPVGSNQVIINGAHRTAIAFVKNLQLQTASQPKTATLYDYNFFMNRHKYGNLKSNIPKSISRVYADEMALEFCRNCPNLRLVIMFPAAIGKETQAMNILKSNANILYAVNITASLRFLDNLIKELYRGEKWIGGFNSSKSMGKSKLCWNSKNPHIRIFLIEPKKSCVETKKSIRALYGIGNHSVHINDTHEETMRIASSVFNANSRHLLQNSTGVLDNAHQALLQKFKTLVQPNINDYCISASFVLSIYGLRAARDLDYIHVSPSLAKTVNIDSHNKYIDKLYPYSAEEIIYNPDNHFYFAGVKFCSLGVLKMMKNKRGESKDVVDCKLIDTIINLNPPSNIILTK